MTRPTARQRDEKREPKMRQKQHGKEPNARRQPSRGADVLVKALQNQRTISAQPERMREDDDQKKDQRDPRLRM